jgi:ABC-type glycerol-3-phosphate transport system substrate-binding protein
MAPIPRPATNEARTTYGRLYAFAIPKASKNAVGAERTAATLTGKDILPEIARVLGMAPAQRALLVPASGDLFEPVYYPQALMARGWLSPSPLDTDTLFGTMVGSVTSGRQDPASAITTLDQALNAALR